MANKLYVTKCIASVYQIGYSLLSLNIICMFSVFLPPFCCPSLPPFFTSFCFFVLFVYSFIVLLSFSFIYTFPPVLSFRVNTHSGSSDIESAMHCTEPAFFQPWFEETDDKHRKRQWKRWLRQSLMFCHAILCCGFVQWESCVVTKTYRGSNGRSSCSVSSWKLLTTNKHYEFFWNWYLSNSFLGIFQSL